MKRVLMIAALLHTSLPAANGSVDNWGRRESHCGDGGKRKWWLLLSHCLLIALVLSSLAMGQSGTGCPL